MYRLNLKSIMKENIYMFEFALIAFVTLLANTIGILSGFATGTLLMPVLLFFLPFESALLLSTIIVVFHNVWKVIFFYKNINWRMVVYFGLPGMLSTFIGATFVSELINNDWAAVLQALLGVFLVGYVLFLFIFPTFKIIPDKKMSLFGGGLQGFFAGIFGIKGPLRTVFLIAYDLPKKEYLGTIGAISIFVDSTRLITYFWQGLQLDNWLLKGLLVWIPASFIGAKIAVHYVYLIPQKHFRGVVAMFLLIVGLFLLFFPYHTAIRSH